jgi:RNA polymerase sigma factor (sigma-70 family)
MSGKYTYTDDGTLIKDLAEGDPAAQVYFVEHHYGKAYAISYRILRNRVLAEDAAIIAITSALRAIIRPSFELKSPLYLYVRTCAVRAALCVGRRDYREGQPPIEAQTQALPYRLDHLDRLAIREAIERCLDQIEPPERRQAVIICVIEGRTQREAAVTLGVALGSINEWLNAEKKNFRICILCSGVYRPRLLKGNSNDD